MAANTSGLRNPSIEAAKEYFAILSYIFFAVDERGGVQVNEAVWKHDYVSMGLTGSCV